MVVVKLGGVITVSLHECLNVITNVSDTAVPDGSFWSVSVFVMTTVFVFVAITSSSGFVA